MPVHVSASVGAAPGIYTATLTGTLNGHTRSVNIPVTVGAINGIPLLYEAVPIKPDGPDAGTEEDITDVPGDATKVYIAGLLKGDPDTAYTVVLRTATSCPNGSLDNTAATIALPVTPLVTPTFDGTASFAGAVPVSAGQLKRYVSAQFTAPGSPGLIGPCIVVSPPNDQWPFAFDISSRTAGSGTPTQGYIDVPGRARWYKFNVTPGSSVHVALSGLPADTGTAHMADALGVPRVVALHGQGQAHFERYAPYWNRRHCVVRDTMAAITVDDVLGMIHG